MKYFKFLFVVVFVLLTFTNCSYSQPRFILSVYGGGSIPTGDFGRNPAYIPDSTYYLETNYGMKIGWNIFNAEMKYAFDKNRHVRGVFGLSFNTFLNPSGILTFWYSTPVRESIGIVSTYLGTEYAFLPKERIDPFVGARFAANFISGDNFKSETRYGLEFTLGMDITASEHFGLLAGFKYDIANLMGKETKVAAFDVYSNNLPLSDEGYTYHEKTIDSKSISFIQFYFGLSFFFGQPKKVQN